MTDAPTARRSRKIAHATTEVRHEPGHVAGDPFLRLFTRMRAAAP